MKRLTIARKDYYSAIASIDSVINQVRTLRKDANFHLDNHNIDSLIKINREYVLLREKYLNAIALRDQADKDMLFLLSNRLLDEIDYQFFTIPYQITRSGRRSTYLADDFVLCVKQKLSTPELNFFLSNFQGDPNLFSVITKEIEEGYMLIFSMANPLNGNKIDLTLDEVNRSLGWLTGITDKKTIIEKYQLSIFTDDLIPA